MSVLKIKDQNGNWIQIPTIKGEDGQDYILTEQDKEDIAELIDAPVEDVKIENNSIVNNGIVNIPIASTSQAGVAHINTNNGIGIQNGYLFLCDANSGTIKLGNHQFRAIVPLRQHESVFYGLAKASGDSTQSASDNAVGTYTDEAKASIQSMLGVANKANVLIVTIGDVINSDNGIYEIDSTFTDISNALESGANVIVKNLSSAVLPYVGKTYINSNDVFAFGISVTYNGMAILQGYLITRSNTAIEVNQYTTIPVNTSDLINNSLVEDVQINGTSVVSEGVANIPKAGTNFGVVKINNSGENIYGIGINTDGQLYIAPANATHVKQGTATYRPICASRQHESTFYGLAKAAGDTTQSQSSNTVGTYTDEAKTAIKQMLDVKDDYDSLVVEVSGTDPVITGKPSYRYNCGELYTLTVTPPASGTMDIIFTSGTTPTVLSLPNTVKMPDWWAGIETNTTYEMCITDGTYCGVMSWAT